MLKFAVQILWHTAFQLVIYCSHDLRYLATRSVLWRLKCTKFVFRRGSTPHPAGGAHDAPPDLLVGWGGGYPLPILHPLDAYGVSFSAPAAPHFEFVGKACSKDLGGIDAPALVRAISVARNCSCDRHQPVMVVSGDERCKFSRQGPGRKIGHETAPKI